MASRVASAPFISEIQGMAQIKVMRLQGGGRAELGLVNRWTCVAVASFDAASGSLRAQLEHVAMNAMKRPRRTWRGRIQRDELKWHP